MGAGVECRRPLLGTGRLFEAGVGFLPVAGSPTAIRPPGDRGMGPGAFLGGFSPGSKVRGEEATGVWMALD